MRITKRFRLIIFSVLMGCGVLVAFANTSSHQGFVVKHIKIVGSRRVPDRTVKAYLPISVGDKVTPAKISEAIKTLYKTNLFTNIGMSRSGHTLIVNVSEQATVTNISVEGNALIKKEQIMEIFKHAGIYAGATYRPSILERIKRSLEAQYDSLGYYNVKIRTDVLHTDQNRVSLDVKIAEGKIATIKEIHILGNHVFTEKQIRKQMTLTTSSLLTLITRDDRYTESKFHDDLTAIHNLYTDHGYVRFKIDSTQVSLSPDKQSVYITIHVKEGHQYTLSGYAISGDTVFPKAKIEKMIHAHVHAVFSRKDLADSADRIGHALGNRGFYYAKVRPIPTVNDAKHSVFVNFYIEPGPRMYVRRILFKGNNNTEDSVFRHAMIQDEGTTVSAKGIKESTRRIRNLGYVGHVDMKVKPVAGRSDQMDLEYHVKETPPGKVFVQAGYSTNGPVFGAGVNQNNFMGTGRAVALNFNQNDLRKSYQFSYNNPFYTVNGVSRGFNVYYDKYTPGKFDIADYSHTGYGAELKYGIPLTDYQTLSLGFGYDATDINTRSNSVQEYINFVNRYGKFFKEAKLILGWDYSNLDRSEFPTSGTLQQASVALATRANGDSLDYYKLHYAFHRYFPLTEDHRFIFTVLGGVGYGNGYRDTAELPFFENYFAGGMDSVRGYENNSLGPRSQTNRHSSLGGNESLRASIELIFPNPISEHVRTSIFVDGGQVYNSEAERATFSGGGPRYSAGLNVLWQVPYLATIRFSFAKALNSRGYDETQIFQFELGTGF